MDSAGRLAPATPPRDGRQHKQRCWALCRDVKQRASRQRVDPNGVRFTRRAHAPRAIVNSMNTSPANGPDTNHERPRGATDATVEALGKLSEALEVVEHARGYLYGFHRLTGTADLALGEAVDSLRDAGHAELADAVQQEIVGRNVIEGRWTFQIVEDYDDNYYAAFKAMEKRARNELLEGKRHLFEAEMKEDRRTHGQPHHEALPPAPD